MAFYQLLVILCFVYVAFLWWRGKSLLKAFKRGANGPFTVTEMLKGPAGQYLAIDAEAQKLALINVTVDQPWINDDKLRGFIFGLLRYEDITVVFSIEDIESISVKAFAISNADVTFYFNKPIPKWSDNKSIEFKGTKRLRNLFDKYLSEVPVKYSFVTKDGKREPWL